MHRLTLEEKRDFVHDAHKYCEIAIRDIHEELRAEIELHRETGVLSAERENTLHAVLENYMHVKKIAECFAEETAAPAQAKSAAPMGAGVGVGVAR